MTIEYKDSKRISALSSDLEGLKAYWKMNDSSGKLLNTASSQGNTALSGSDLTVSGTTGYGVTGHVSGVNAYSFTNADGNKAVADNSASDWNFLTNSGNKFTITLWLKLDSNNVNADFIGTGGSGSNDFAIRYRGSVADKKFAIFFSNEGEKITSTSTTLTDTNWHFYMIQYDDSVGTLRFQKDNLTVEEFTGLNLTSTGNPTTALSFGDSHTSTSETGGDMQEVTVWDRYLTTAEIAQIYNTNSGAQLQNTTIPFGGRPTNVQDNSLLVEKDTGRRYWVDISSTSSSQTSTNDARSLKAGNRNKIGQQFNTDHVLVGQAPTKATFYLSKGGSPPNNVTAYIRNSSGTLRETSTTTIVANNLTGSAVATDFTFAGTTTLATGDMITVEYNSGDNTHYVNAWTNNLSAVTNSVLRGYTSSWSDISGEALKFIVYYTPATWTMQPTFTSDFTSTSGWTSTNSAFAINTSDVAIIANNDNVTTNLQIGHDLGSGNELSDTAWVIDADVKITAYTASGGLWTHIGMYDCDTTVLDSTNKDFLGMILYGESATNAIVLVDADSQLEGTLAPTTTSIAITGTPQLYLRMKRTASNKLTIESYSTSARTGTPSTTTTRTLSGNPQNLRYFKITNRDGGGSGELDAKIENVKIYNGVTSIN